MLQIERAEKIEVSVKFPDLVIGEVFTWGAAYDPYIKVNADQGFRLSTPHGLSFIDKNINLIRCEAKLVVTNIAPKYKASSSGI